MVNIKIVIEGGVFPGENIDSATFDNSEKFRESFHKLLSAIFLPSLFNLEIEIGTGDKMAAKSFKQIQAKKNCILVIDLDGTKGQKPAKLLYLELTECSEQVFFMVQEMEAWILSQPECIIK